MICNRFGSHVIFFNIWFDPCQVIVASPVDMMCNCYGSHVFRSLLCLCGGVPLDSPVFHRAKSSMILAERLNLSTSSAPGNNLSHHHQGFPGLLKFLVSGMLKCSEEDVKYLLVDQYSSLVFQACWKVSPWISLCCIFVTRIIDAVWK